MTTQAHSTCIRCGDFCQEGQTVLSLALCQSCFECAGWDSRDLPIIPKSSTTKQIPWLIAPFFIGGVIGLFLVLRLKPSADWIDLILLPLVSAFIACLFPYLLFPRLNNFGNPEWKQQLLSKLGLAGSPSIPFELVLAFRHRPALGYTLPAKASMILLRAPEGIILLGSRAQSLSLAYSQLQTISVEWTWHPPFRRVLRFEYLDSKQLSKELYLILLDKIQPKANRQASLEWLEELQARLGE